MKKIPALVLCILLPLLTGGISAYFTVTNVRTWYPSLHKPVFNPPNAVFGPVWTLLYVLMGISLYMVVRLPSSAGRNKAVLLFFLQLFFNFWWSILFFYFHLVGIALADILLLLFFILLMIRRFYPLSASAAGLQWPYVGWVAFATVLNVSIWLLN